MQPLARLSSSRPRTLPLARTFASSSPPVVRSTGVYSRIGLGAEPGARPVLYPKSSFHGLGPQNVADTVLIGKLDQSRMRSLLNRVQALGLKIVDPSCQ